MRRKGKAKALYISYHGNLQVFNEKHTYLSPSLSPLIYKLPKRYIKRYKRKYLGRLQGETRKLHKISEDKNLTESVHKKISHTMQNLAWCAKSIGCLKWFCMVCEISHNHAKLLVAGLLPCISDWFGKGLWSAPKLGFFMYLSFNLHCHWFHNILSLFGLFQW